MKNKGSDSIQSGFVKFIKGLKRAIGRVHRGTPVIKRSKPCRLKAGRRYDNRMKAFILGTGKAGFWDGSNIDDSPAFKHRRQA